MDFEVLPGDHFLICSDGLHHYLKDGDVPEILQADDVGDAPPGTWIIEHGPNGTTSTPGTPRSILAATIAHGFATAGFLSWADFYLYLRQRRRFLATVRAGKIANAS